MSNNVQFTLGWKDKGKRWGHPMHSMCSYLAMFPASIPSYYINLLTKPGDIVFDPFGGRGTTPLEALILGRKGIGNDLNPLATLLISAKMSHPDIQQLLNRIEQLRQQYLSLQTLIDFSKEPDKIQMLFHDNVIRQLIFLKQNLDLTNDVDNFIMATLSGIIHGASSLYLSVSMPKTFSMSANYVKGYIIKKQLPKPDRNTFDNLKAKIEMMYAEGVPTLTGKHYVSDVRNLSQVVIEHPNLLVTSPPYMKVVQYGYYNWIRLWLLNLEADDVDDKLDDRLNYKKYVNFIRETLRECYAVMAHQSYSVFIIGDVQVKNKPLIRLAEDVWKELSNDPSHGYKLDTILEDIVPADRKVSKIFGSKEMGTPKGNATATDRHLILWKD